MKLPRLARWQHAPHCAQQSQAPSLVGLLEVNNKQLKNFRSPCGFGHYDLTVNRPVHVNNQRELDHRHIHHNGVTGITRHITPIVPLKCLEPTHRNHSQTHWLPRTRGHTGGPLAVDAPRPVVPRLSGYYGLRLLRAQHVAQQQRPALGDDVAVAVDPRDAAAGVAPRGRGQQRGRAVDAEEQRGDHQRERGGHSGEVEDEEAQGGGHVVGPQHEDERGGVGGSHNSEQGAVSAAPRSGLSRESQEALDEQVSHGRKLAERMKPLWEMGMSSSTGGGNISCWSPVGDVHIGDRGDGITGERIVPKIIHQINIKKAASDPEIPTRFLEYTYAWRRLNPDFIYLLWDNNTLEEMVHRVYPEMYVLYLSIDTPVIRADAARLMVLYAYGGVYADLDYELLLPLDPFLPVLNNNNNSDSPPSFGAIKSTPISNFLMYSATKSPFVGAMIGDFANSLGKNRNSFTFRERVLDTLGPQFVARHAVAHPNAYCTFPADMFNPVTACGVHTGDENPVGIHHYALTWGDFSSGLNNWYKCNTDSAETIWRSTTYFLVGGSVLIACAIATAVRKNHRLVETNVSLEHTSSAHWAIFLSASYAVLSLGAGIFNRLFLLPIFQKLLPEMYFLFLAFSQVLIAVAFLSIFFVSKALDFRIDKRTLLECIPCSLSFVGMVGTSFLSFKFLPVTTIFLWKSFSSLMTAVGDWLVFNRPMTLFTATSFLVMIVSCFFFTLESPSLTWDFNSLAWISANVLFTSFFTLSYSRVISRSPSSPLSTALVINLMSAAILAVILICLGSFNTSVTSTINGGPLIRMCFVFSLLFSFLLCLCTVFLLRVTSPTSLCMVGQFNKIGLNLATGRTLESFGGFMGSVFGVAGATLFVLVKANQHSSSHQPGTNSHKGNQHPMNKV
ncbi:glycosyl transferase [Pelomyxa schiedti]|nr:glycosyl transferase [Pelomyxa schiedti]